MGQKISTVHKRKKKPVNRRKKDKPRKNEFSKVQYPESVYHQPMQLKTSGKV